MRRTGRLHGQMQRFGECNGDEAVCLLLLQHGGGANAVDHSKSYAFWIDLDAQVQVHDQIV